MSNSSIILSGLNASASERAPDAAPDAVWKATAIQIVESALGPKKLGGNFRAELASLQQEEDPEIFWNDLLRAVERREVREGDGTLLPIFSAWLSMPGLSPSFRAKLEQHFEEAQGRGDFGARGENFLSQLTRQAFDVKSVALMLAAGLFGKVAQASALARLSAGAPRWWSSGLAGRSLAISAGFSAELSVLGAAHGEFGRSALSLAAMKAGLWGGTKARLPVPLTLLGGTVLALKGEEALGWRAPTSISASLAEAGASALSFGIGYSLATRLLGPRFQGLQQRLSLANHRRFPPRPSAGFELPSDLVPLGPRASQIEPSNLPKPIFMSEGADSRNVGKGFSTVSANNLALKRVIPAASGAGRPFELLLSAENRRPFIAEAEGLEGQRTAIALRDDSILWVKVDKKALNQVGDPITPAGVTRVNFRLEEGDTRGRAFIYYDSKSVTLFFIDLEETMITGGPAMRPGTGSVFLTWLAEQAWREGKSFNVTRITSPQTVKIMEKMKLIEPNCRVESCARLNPESLDEEYRVLAEFPFGDRSAWGSQRFEVEFFNVYGRQPE